MPVHRSRRPAFTLVELIVVIAIIGVLAALTATLLPNFQDTELTNRGADQLQNWLLSAKMQAKRDGLPTGLRLNFSPTNPALVTTVDYIQQPNNFAVGIFTGADTDPNPNVFTGPRPGPPPIPGFPRAKFFIPPPPPPPAPPSPQVTFFDGTAGYIVQPGDYLEIYGGGFLHQIVRVPQPLTDVGFFPPSANENAALILAQTTMPLPWTSATPPLTSSAINYRIIPQPQVMNGEQTLSLPTNIAISFETPISTSPNFKLSQNVPTRTVNGVTFTEILFAPSGAVVGQGTGTGQIILWVRNTSEPIVVSPNPDLLVGKGTLIAIQPRTGFIAAHPASSGTDPYIFLRDGSSSGL